MNLSRKPCALRLATDRLHGGLVALLVLALLWAQALGLAHRVLHAPLSGGLAEAAQIEKARQSQAVRTRSGLLDHLLLPTQVDPSCQSYDQLGLGESPLSLPALLVPVLQPAWLQAAAIVLFQSAVSAFFDARGPPAVS